MKSIPKNLILAGATGFLLGAILMYGLSKTILRTHFASDPKLPTHGIESSNDPFEEMRRMQERMLEDTPEELQNPFDSFFGSQFGGGSRSLKFEQRDDENFLYYDITVPGLKNEKLNVGVENGMVTVSGVMEQKIEGPENQSISTTSFQRSLPLPPDVDGDKVEADINGDKLILKFPKKKQ